MPQTKIIVLDDDPTGSQTVHGCLLLTRWDVLTLQQALHDSSPLFFVLTNTRGMDAQQAAAITREVCVNLKKALATQGNTLQPIMVSRSDSTLRGHYPVETDVIAQEMGPFDAHFLTPAFFEGGRITRDSVHYLMVNGKAVPVHETEFAKDSVFGYQHSYLPDYVQEKTKGRIRAEQVERFLLSDIRASDVNATVSVQKESRRQQQRPPLPLGEGWGEGANPKGDIATRLRALNNNRCCVVDAETQQDMDNFATQVSAAAAEGKRFLFRSAASLLTSLARLPAQPVAAEAMREYVRNGKPGAVIVGSHVKKTTAQLTELLKQPGVVPLEVDVARIGRERDALLRSAIDAAATAHSQGKTPVIYTSRVELTFADQQTRLQFGVQVSALLMDIVRNLPRDIGFLISKGGITSNDVLSDGLALCTSRVLGQILAGCSVVRCPQDHARFPDLPVVIFPGNVGDEFALATVYSRLSGVPINTTQAATVTH